MSSVRRNWIAVFYWLGVAMTLGCFALIVAGNTELFGRFEHRGFPLLIDLAHDVCGAVYGGGTL